MGRVPLSFRLSVCLSVVRSRKRNIFHSLTLNLNFELDLYAIKVNHAACQIYIG